jgi:hypothetical protein
MPIDASAITRAYLVKPEEEADVSKRIAFDFNPGSLQYTLEAGSQQQNQPDRTGQTQHVSQFTAKLSFDAIFDNTDIGEDVRSTTSLVAAFLRPAPPAAGASPNSGSGAPPLALFHWGAFRFQGVLTQYRETLDFFSKEGVPLRSTLSLAMAEQGPPLPQDANTPTTSTGRGGSLVPTGSSDSALSVATRGGNPAAARALASANGLASLRATGGATLEIGGAVSARASAGFTAGGSTSDASATWNASGSGNLFNARSSAGVSASSGAFAGISMTGDAGRSTTAGLNASAITSGGVGADLAARAGASFSIGGGAQMSAGIGLSADVGAKANWKDLLQFDED